MTKRQKWLIAGVGLAAIIGYVAYRRRRGGLGKVRFVVQRYAEAPAIDGFNDGDMQTVLRSSPEMPIEERLASIQTLVSKSVLDPGMRKIALEVTSSCPERDGECEARAVYDFVKANVRYSGDIAPIAQPDGTVEGIDLYQSARRTLEFGAGDCLPMTALVLRDDYELVPLVDLEAGNRIMGDGGWAVVQDRWLTDEKALLAFHLSNGCVLRCTPEHRIFRNVDGRVEEIRAGEARVGDDLVTPEAIPVRGVSVDSWPEVARGLTEGERAWLLGVFVADGWAEGSGAHIYRASISGLDGDRKEAQKHRIKALMEKIGVSTYWHTKHIRIQNPALAQFFAGFGHTAINKHASLSHASQDDVRAMLDGLAADADQRNNVYGTISSQLALQLRVLYRMLGRSVHIKLVDNHGGLGKNPIYRVTPRSIDNDRRDIRFSRIRAIEDGGVEMCMDLTTDSGKFWLPESDTIVHNCDDQSILVSALLALNGITPRLRVMKQRRGEDFSHIFPLAGLPKGDDQRWVPLDTTLPGNTKFGKEVPYAEALDFPA